MNLEANEISLKATEIIKVTNYKTIVTVQKFSVYDWPWVAALLAVQLNGVKSTFFLSCFEHLMCGKQKGCDLSETFPSQWSGGSSSPQSQSKLSSILHWDTLKNREKKTTTTN